MKNTRFMVGLVGVALVVTYLAWTGISDTMVYYLTPAELMARVDSDPTFAGVGVKVSGKVVPGSYVKAQGELLHSFRVRDIENESVTFPVEFRDVIPDTFNEDMDVVLEGRFDDAGVFQATTLLTKCGSRYEVAPEDLRPSDAARSAG
ncbi:MAG TPA: cytochrome c maturation protein CcmE [Longimicrobiales bacterium]|jgi:cytochrome c-type biogenesis protein CcmE